MWTRPNDGEKPILEYSSTGIVGRNVYGKGIDEILMRTSPGANGGQPYYYAQDHEGSVTHLINGCSTVRCPTGDVLERYKYDAFGAPTILDGNDIQIDHTAYNNRFLFTGREYAATYRQQYVQAFTFYEYRARAYNPTLGRFMSEDPKLFDAGDYNLFRYCHNDPIDFTDPMGLLPNMPYHWTPELQQAMDRAYNNIMAKAQWQQSLSGSGIGGAIGAGMAGHQGWSQLSKAMNSAHSVTTQSFIQGKSVLGFRGDNHGFTDSPLRCISHDFDGLFQRGEGGLLCTLRHRPDLFSRPLRRQGRRFWLEGISYRERARCHSKHDRFGDKSYAEQRRTSYKI
jgi:RHS repeat-associated protein